MASDLHHPRRLSDDGPSVDDNPSTSSSFSVAAAPGFRAKLLCSYGGKILPRPSDGALRYVGGETRIITIRREAPLPEILRKLAEAYGGPIVLRYQLPDEDLDALISVSTSEDLDNMMDEYDKLVADNPSAKLRVFLSPPADTAGIAADQYAGSLELQEPSMLYIEAVNGVETHNILSKDSLSTAQNSNGTVAGAEIAADSTDEGLFPALPSPSDMSAQDHVSTNFAVQNTPDSPTITGSFDQIEVLTAAISELPPPSQTELPPVQSELPPAPPSVPQAYIEPCSAQFVNHQPFVVVGLPTQANVIAMPPHMYLSAMTVTHPPPPAQLSNSVPVQTRVEASFEENHNGAKIAKPPVDPKFQPLSQLPPIPPPHLLFPNGERTGSRQVPPPSKLLRLEECIMCQKALPHSHSDTLISDQANGSKSASSEAKLVLQSQLSEDITRTQVAQLENLAPPAPSGTYGFTGTTTIPEVRRIIEKPVLNSETVDPIKVLTQPGLVGLAGTSQTAVAYETQAGLVGLAGTSQTAVAYETMANSPRINHEEYVPQPASFALPRNLGGMLISAPQSQQGEASQEEQQNVGLSRNFVKQDAINNLFPNLQEGKLIQENDLVAPSMCAYIRPTEGMFEAVQSSANSLFFNDDPQKILGSAPLVSSNSNVASKEPVLMDFHHENNSTNNTELDGTLLSRVLSSQPPDSLNKDLLPDPAQPSNDVHIEQPMQASEETTEAFMNIGHLQVINNCDLEELHELGSGTFGTVFHGKWRGTDVAIKRLHNRVFGGKQSEQKKARNDFWNEAIKLASLHHPNVVAFYGVVMDGPDKSMATLTEFMVNGSLRHALQNNERILDRRKRLVIAGDVAIGMEYLHSKDIIHFDLKSDNLLVNLRDPQRPICKVGDLGLSKVKYETLMSGGMRGTLPWMAPELLGGKDYSEKVDVFSFGIVLWELLTAEEPYADLHYGAIIGGIINNTLRPSVPESCDPEWRSLMEQCWSNDPSERPSFTEIANRLRAMQASFSQKK